MLLIGTCVWEHEHPFRLPYLRNFMLWTQFLLLGNVETIQDGLTGNLSNMFKYKSDCSQSFTGKGFRDCSL